MSSCSSYSFSSFTDSPRHPLALAGAISDSLQAELDIILATTNAAENLYSKQTEVKCAATSAACKQMQIYRKRRKEILHRLIKEKKEYIEILKRKIEELDAEDPSDESAYSYSYAYSYTSESLTD